MRLTLIIGFLYTAFTLLSGCSNSSYPCPKLSNSGDDSKNLLVKHNVSVDKHGRVKKKSVKKVRKR